jgi:hypothetical protein
VGHAHTYNILSSNHRPTPFNTDYQKASKTLGTLADSVHPTHLLLLLPGLLDLLEGLGPSVCHPLVQDAVDPAQVALESLVVAAKALHFVALGECGCLLGGAQAGAQGGLEFKRKGRDSKLVSV